MRRFSICAAVAFLSLAASARARPVPATFVGVNVTGPMLTQNVDLASQFQVMRASGLGTVRVTFDWSQAQPYRRFSDVPASQRERYVVDRGVPTDFSATDRIVTVAAEHGITVLPTILYAPSWDRGRNRGGGAGPPARSGPYANYLKALIARYGPHGGFWRTHRPRLPIRAWQIWNEPNLRVYWPQPFAHGYARLLRAAHAAIRRADRGASVVLGAFTNLAWTDLAKLYAIGGTRKLFDEVAVNGFTSTPRRVIAFLEHVRSTMNRSGDRRKPLLYTEFSWPSARGKSLEQFDWDTTEAGQAQKLAAVLPMLAARRRSLGLRAFYYYTWMSEEVPDAFSDFAFSGLLAYHPDGQIVQKPALAAFGHAALKLERSRAAHG